MVAIKITYGSSVHKFNVATDSTWATFEYNLRTLFKIPDNYKVIASYTDEDNDVITLSSDIELREVLYHHSNDTNTPVRLVLNAIPTTNNSNNNKEIQETFEKMSIADDEKCCATETETETETEREHVCDENCEKSYDEKCCKNKSSNEKCCEEEEEEAEQSSSDPEVYYFVCPKRGPRFGSAKFDSFENTSGRCPFKRGEFVPPPHHRQPRGGSFGPFGPFGPFNHHGGPHPHHRGPGPRGFHGHPPSHPPPEYTKHHGEFEEFGPHGGEFSHFGHGPFGHGSFGHGSFGHESFGHGSFGHGSFGHGRFHGHGGRGPRYNREKECCKEGKECRKDDKECRKDDKECNKDEKCEKDTTDPRVEHGPHVPPGSHGPHSHPAFRGPHGPHGHHGNPRMRGHNHGHHPSFHGHGHGFRHHHHRRPRHNNGGPHCHRHHKPLTPEELAEKVALLNSMNFPSDKNAHYEELLKKFHGRIGRVVEILLCERKHKDDEDHKEPGDDNSDDDSNNDDPSNEFEEIKESETSPFLV